MRCSVSSTTAQLLLGEADHTACKCKLTNYMVSYLFTYLLI